MPASLAGLARQHNKRMRVDHGGGGRLPDLRMTSDAFELCVQRRLRAPIAALGGGRWSQQLGRHVDAYGDTLQNLHAHGARHSRPLRKIVNMMRAVHGNSVRMEDSHHHIYSPGVRPDAAHLHGARDGATTASSSSK